MVGNTPAISNSIARVTAPHATGSDVARNGTARGDNIDAAAESRVASATQNALWRDSLYGTIDGINAGLANAASFQNGLFESQSLPPSGVNGTGATAKSNGAAGGAGAQNTTSTNPNNGGISPSQLAALNQANKLPPELLAKLLAEKTNKTEARRDPELKKQGHATADPKLNEALKELGSNLEKKIKDFDNKLKEALKGKTDEEFRDEFKNSGFNTKQELHDFNDKMREEIKAENFNQETYDKFDKFLKSIPEKDEYKELKEEGLDIQDTYKKGLDERQNNIVAGNFITAADEITKGDENKDGKSFLQSFTEQAADKGLIEKDEDGKIVKNEDGSPKFVDTENGQKAKEFYETAQSTIDKTNTMMRDRVTGAAEMEEFLQSGEFNENITKLKELYGTEEKPGFGAELGLGAEDENFAKNITNNMMFMQYSSPYSEGASQQNQGLQEILDSKAKGEKVTVQDLIDNPKTRENIGEYYEGVLELEEGQTLENLIIPQKEEQESAPKEFNYGQSAVVMNQTENAADAISNLEDSVAFADDIDDLDIEDEIDDLDLDFDEEIA